MCAVHAASKDPDHATRDLFDAIAKGDYPSWTVSIQVCMAGVLSALPLSTAECITS